MRCRACRKDDAVHNYRATFLCDPCFRAILALDRFLPEDDIELSKDPGKYIIAVDDRSAFIYAITEDPTEPSKIKKITNTKRARWLECRDWWANNRLGLNDW